MPDKLPAQVWRRFGRGTAVFRSPAAGEEDALPPEFALPHNVEPPVPVGGSHVNWAQVTSTETEEDQASLMRLDIDRMMKDEH